MAVCECVDVLMCVQNKRIWSGQLVLGGGGAMVKMIREDSAERAKLNHLFNLSSNTLSVVPIVAQKSAIVAGWDAVLMPRLHTLADVMERSASQACGGQYRTRVKQGLNALVHVRGVARCGVCGSGVPGVGCDPDRTHADTGAGAVAVAVAGPTCRRLWANGCGTGGCTGT